jgi:hypothetical protein
MRIPLLDGRDFHSSAVDPGAAIVSKSFANRYFPSENPVGRSFQKTEPTAKRTVTQWWVWLQTLAMAFFGEHKLPVLSALWFLMYSP